MMRFLILVILLLLSSNARADFAINNATGTFTVLDADVNGDGSQIIRVVPSAGTTGGATAYFLQPAASDNHAVIKAGAGVVYGIAAFNNSATINYVRLYNATTGFNGCNSATNHVTQFQIPASTAVGGFTFNLGPGITFSTGISICVTSGYALTDTTNATASAMSLTVLYK